MEKNIRSFSLTTESSQLIDLMAKKLEVTRSMFIKMALADYIARNFGDIIKPSDLAELIKDRRLKE